MIFLTQVLLGMNTLDDRKARARFVAIDNKSFARRKVKTNNFFVTHDVGAMKTQPIHADNDVETFN